MWKLQAFQARPKFACLKICRQRQAKRYILTMIHTVLEITLEKAC